MKNILDNKYLSLLFFSMSKIIPFIMVPIYGTWLTVSDYGMYDLYVTLAILLAPFITVAIEEAVFRYSVEESDMLIAKQIISSGFLVVCLNFVIVTVIIALICYWQYDLTYIIFAVYLFSVCLFNFLQGYVRGCRRLVLYSFDVFLAAFFSAVFSFILILFFNANLKGMLIGHACGYIFADVVICICTKWVYDCSIYSSSRWWIYKLVSYSAPLIINGVSWWIINMSDRILIWIFLGESYTGIYAMACKIPAICTTTYPLISAVWQEKFIGIQRKEENEKEYNVLLNKITCVILLVSMSVVFCNDIIFAYFIDDKFKQASNLALILIIAAVLQLIATFFGSIQISMMKAKTNGKSTFFGAISNILINIILIRYIGIWAAVISTLLSYFIVAEIRFLDIRKRYIFRIYMKTYIYITIFLLAIYLVWNTNSLIVNIIGAVVSLIWAVYEFFMPSCNEFKEIT